MPNNITRQYFIEFKKIRSIEISDKKRPLSDVLKTFIKGRTWDDGLRRNCDVQIRPLRDVQGTLD